MLDIKRLRENFGEVKAGIEKRGKGDFDLPEILKIDKKKRALLFEVEKLKNQQNISSKKIPVLKKQGQNTEELRSELKNLSNRISELDIEISKIDD